MSVIVLGHGRHGKDTVGEILRDEFGLRFESSSWNSAEHVIFPVLSVTMGYTNVKECFDDRHNHRSVWRALITQFNLKDPTTLTRKILRDNDAYIGMRCPREYKASEHLFDIKFYVDASERHPLEPSMGIDYNPKTMFRIDNNGGLDDLRKNVIAAAHGTSLVC